MFLNLSMTMSNYIISKIIMEESGVKGCIKKWGASRYWGYGDIGISDYLAIGISDYIFI
jgi:hypothetical protein